MKPIQRILIANRGEIARRIIRTAHKMGIETVVVYAESDARSLPVREATLSYALEGCTSGETYLDAVKILAAAKATGADAIHPGYGFLSENAQFAQSVQDAGLTWIGPSPHAIQAVGSKAGAKQLAAAVGVPCLPGYFGADQSDAALWKAAQALGFPLMVKASEGGGGRGMRLVLGAEASQQEVDLLQATAVGRSEAFTAFGSSHLVLERALLNPRHVEVQIFADSHGHGIHLGERDCSVQRRYQKIIEESPSPMLKEATRTALCSAAVKLAMAANYEGAGTVEFLVETSESSESSEMSEHFYLLEMNTRLQVEHTVTEMRTGLDLVEWQIRIARGEVLPLTQDEVRLAGHAIEVRLCAEDDSFMPQIGKIVHFRAPPESQTLRLDHAIETGSEVTPYFDAMLGKVITHAASRAEAIDALITALQKTEVLGLATNRGFLIECLDTALFRSGLATVPFLALHGDEIRASLASKRAKIPVTTSVNVALQGRATSALSCPFPRPVRIKQNEHIQDAAWLAGQEAQGARVLPVSSIRLGKSGFHAQQGGIDWFLEDASFAPPVQTQSAMTAAEIRAPFNGRVIAVNAQPGQAVAAGDTLFVIESMKLEHAVQAARAGTMAEVLIETGQQVSPRQVLGRFLI